MKRVIKCILFFIIFMILLLILSNIVKPKNNTEDAGIEEKFLMATGILAEPDNSIDVLVIGDSESYSSFIPLEIWNSYGYTSYVCGTAAQPLAQTCSFIYDILQKQSPKVVVLEANTIYRRKNLGMPLEIIAGKFFPIFEYHDRWKTLSPKDFKNEIEYTNIQNDKGYYYSDRVQNGVNKNYMDETNTDRRIAISNRIFVRLIKAYCESKGAKFMMYNAPSSKNWSYKKHNGVVKFTQQLGIEYVDLNTMQKEVPIDWKTESRDDGDHINHSGALKVTKFMGKYLYDNNELPDHRNDINYNSWNEAYINYKKMTESNKK